MWCTTVMTMHVWTMKTAAATMANWCTVCSWFVISTWCSSHRPSCIFLFISKIYFNPAQPSFCWLPTRTQLSISPVLCTCPSGLRCLPYKHVQLHQHPNHTASSCDNCCWESLRFPSCHCCSTLQATTTTCNRQTLCCCICYHTPWLLPYQQPAHDTTQT
ncbi:hypothetical protein COO60DRAFT_1478955 [Scenedesmus sp. NREL 46B-D3]|nr:hypothetical protein COO60DRAFT_1478955 [Scenedesmus sp. NREL 46B-D3]